MPEFNIESTSRNQLSFELREEGLDKDEQVVDTAAKEQLLLLDESYSEAPDSLEDHTATVMTDTEEAEPKSLLKNVPDRPAARSYVGKEESSAVDSPPSYPPPLSPDELTKENADALGPPPDIPDLKQDEPTVTIQQRAQSTPPPTVKQTAGKLSRIRSGFQKLRAKSADFIHKHRSKPAEESTSTGDMLTKLGSQSKSTRKTAIAQLSRELKLANSELLKDVDSKEFDARKFDSSKPEDIREASHLHRLASQQEAIQSMVKHQVLTGTIPTDGGEPRLLGKEERQQVIESLIDVADTSAKEGDFLTSNAITAALNSAELTPAMNNTKLSSKSAEKLTSLSNLQFQKSYFIAQSKSRKEGKGFIPAPGPTFTSITQKADQTVDKSDLEDADSDVSVLLRSFPEGASIKKEMMESGKPVPFDKIIREKHKSDLNFAKGKASSTEESPDISNHLNILRAGGKTVDSDLEGIRKEYSSYFKGNTSETSLRRSIGDRSVKSEAHILGYSSQKQGLLIDTSKMKPQEQKDFALGQQQALKEQAPKKKKRQSAVEIADIPSAKVEAYRKNEKLQTAQAALQGVISMNTSAYGSNVILRKFDTEDNEKFIQSLENAFIFQTDSTSIKKSAHIPLARTVQLAKKSKEVREKISKTGIRSFYNDKMDSANTGRAASSSTELSDHRIVDDFDKTELSNKQKSTLEEARDELRDLQQQISTNLKKCDSSSLSKSMMWSVEANIDRMLKELSSFV